MIIDEKAHFQKINGPQSCDKNVLSGNGGVSHKKPFIWSHTDAKIKKLSSFCKIMEDALLRINQITL